MTGPSLKKPEAHSSIHEAALNEAQELRDLLAKCLQNGEKERALKVAEIVIEHWESRTLKHAEAEEESLYKELVEEHPELEHLVIQLTRDHDLMRKILEQVKELLSKNMINERMIALLDSLMIVDLLHNCDEMNKLLVHNEG